MLTAKVNKSLRRIISSKKKVLEIQHVIASKRIRDSKTSSNLHLSTTAEDSKVIQSYESSMQKLSFMESCMADNEYLIINLLRDDRYEELSMKEIYDELFMDFKREVAIAPSYHHSIAQTG